MFVFQLETRSDNRLDDGRRLRVVAGVRMSSSLSGDGHDLITTTDSASLSIALGFDSLVVRSDYPAKEILKGISGYVKAGGITAVMGASASGKSVLLQALSGRIQDMFIGGKVYMNGQVVNPQSVDNPIAFVPQGDSVIGDLTAREVTTQTALLKRNDDREKIDKDVDKLLGRLGLRPVADNIIGTLIFVSLP
jgi:ABC-type cobalamin/Fe3+-siderophores transport system ATPase subunit